MQGYDVLYIAESNPGVDDDAVLQMNRDADALLVTADKDFGELPFRLGKVHAGVLLLRFMSLTTRQKAEMVGYVFERYGPELPKRIPVLSDRSIRLRRNYEGSQPFTSR